MDELSLKVLKNVMDFGLRSTRRISKDLEVSHQTVKAKLDKLEKDDVLKGFFAKINYEKLGFVKEEILIKLRSLDLKKLEKAIRTISDRPEVARVTAIKGSHDLVVRIYAKDLNHIHRVEKELRDELKDKLDIERWDSSFIIEEFKTRPSSKILEEKTNEKRNAFSEQLAKLKIPRRGE